MKNSIIIFLLMAFAWSGKPAQDNFDKGTGVAQFTIDFSGFGNRSVVQTRIPAMALAHDHCIVDDTIDGNASIGIGGLLVS